MMQFSLRLSKRPVLLLFSINAPRMIGSDGLHTLGGSYGQKAWQEEIRK
jgi:hypothetical protein